MQDSSPVPWLPLLRQLNESFPRWGIWKNVESALAEEGGDIDAAAPQDDWSAIDGIHTKWALSNGASMVTQCLHVPGVVLMAAAYPGRPTLSELDICSESFIRGKILFRADDLMPLMIDDPRGFRRLRPGAEGLFVFLLNGVAWGGRPNHDVIERKKIIGLLNSDPEGVRSAAALLGRSSVHAIRAADAVCEGQWDRRSLLKVEKNHLLEAMLAPEDLWRRLWFRISAFRSCPLLKVLLSGRRIPDDLEGWLMEVGKGHELRKG
jgi:hypothetical protein